MRNAIILHGRPSKNEYYDPDRPSMSNAHWIPWLQGQLLKHDIETATPEVPYAFAPEWERWVKEVERFDIGPETSLVGHSTGGGFWVRYLTEHPELKVDKVILVAPWVNSKHEDDTDFFDFEINPNVTKQANKFLIIGSDNDGEDVTNSVRFLKEKLNNVQYLELKGYGHFTHKYLPHDTFPELLKELL